MGLIKAALGSAGGVMADQWKEYFYCEAIPATVLAVKGRAAAQYGLNGPHPRGGASCRRTGRRHAGGSRQPQCRSRYGFHGHGDGRSGRRHERPKPLPDGAAAIGTASCSGGSCHGGMGVFLRADRKYRQVLCGMRRTQARP